VVSDQLPRAEQAIAGVAESGKDVALRVELTIERCAVHDDVRVGVGKPAYPFGCGDEA
jgi:hypothetical protein